VLLHDKSHILDCIGTKPAKLILSGQIMSITIRRNDGNCSWFEVLFDERELGLCCVSISAIAAIDLSNSRKKGNSRSTRSSLSKLSKKIGRRPSSSKKNKSNAETKRKKGLKRLMTLSKSKKTGHDAHCNGESDYDNDESSSMVSSLYDDVSALSLDDSSRSTMSSQSYVSQTSSPSQRSPRIHNSPGSLGSSSRRSETSRTCHSSYSHKSNHGSASGKPKLKRRSSLCRVVRRISGNLRKDTDKLLWKDDDDTAATSSSTIGSNSAATEDFRDPTSFEVRAPPRNICTSHPSRRFQKSFVSEKYIGFQEQARRQRQSEERKCKIQSALYICMEEEVHKDYLNDILRIDAKRNTPANSAA